MRHTRMPLIQLFMAIILFFSFITPSTAKMLDSGNRQTEEKQPDQVFDTADKGNLSTASNIDPSTPPDLVISDLSVDVEKGVICATVANTNMSPGLEDVEVSFYCYGKRRGRRYRKEIGSLVISSLACGSKNGATINYDTKVEYVYREIEVLVDPTDKIAEEDETNNKASYKTPKLPPPGLLRIDELDL